MTTFNTVIDGIGCKCKVTFYEADPDGSAGGVCFEFELYDRTGYRAYWLEHMITAPIRTRLLEEFETLRLAQQEEDRYDTVWEP